jgi:hypothetical protein
MLELVKDRDTVSGDGSKTEFDDFDFYIQNDTDLEVYIIDNVAETKTKQTLTTDYSVKNISVDPLGFTVSFLSAPTSDQDVFVIRIMPCTQLLSLAEVTDYDERKITNALDKITALLQQNAKNIERAPQFSSESTTTGKTIAEPSEGKSLKWDSGGNLVNTDNDIDEVEDTVLGYRNAASASASAAAISETNAAASAAIATTIMSGISSGDTVTSALIIAPTSTTSALVVKDSGGNVTLEIKNPLASLHSTYMGVGAGSTGYGLANTAVGFRSLHSVEDQTYDGVTHFSYCTAFGYLALEKNTTGVQNVAIGAHSLCNNTTGLNNVGCGMSTLQENISGGFNAAFGHDAMAYNTTGSSNTAVGSHALMGAVAGHSGQCNVAVGKEALSINSTGSYNTAVGVYAFSNNSTGIGNTALGYNALGAYTVGDYNVAIGMHSAAENTSFTNCVFIGYGAGRSNLGQLSTATGCICIGAETYATADYQAVYGSASITEHIFRGGKLTLPCYATASAPTYKKGSVYFDTTLNKLRVGGASAWETVSSAA